MEDKMIVSKTFFNNMPIKIGINELGNFVVMYSNGQLLLLNYEEKFNIVRLLEIDFKLFQNELNRMIGDFKTIRDNVNVESFPFGMIVVEALNSNRDYWIELSFNWLQELGVINFSDAILEVINNKHISQEIRHKIIKLK